MVASAVVAGVLVVAGFVAFFFAWKGVAATLAIQLQLPYLVSGGLGGLCLLIAGVTILLVQHRRRLDAREYERLIEVLEEAESILDALAEPR